MSRPTKQDPSKVDVFTALQLQGLGFLPETLGLTMGFYHGFLRETVFFRMFLAFVEPSHIIETIVIYHDLRMLFFLLPLR